jgi:NCAIR mutase (PurE)-related protein
VSSDKLRTLLEQVKAGDVEIASAVAELSRLPFVETDSARVDTHRALRQGIPEVVFGSGKTPDQLVEVTRALRAAEQDVLVTRVEPDVAAEVMDEEAGGVFEKHARLLWYGPEQPKIRGNGSICVVSAGSADRPVAAEAERVAHYFGNRVELIQDVGVAGLHRLLAVEDRLREARVLIVVAGMEGALPAVVGGLVDKPVIAVPTSVGYGAALSGLTALFAMLTSCASNVSVVNIDNGFGAAHVATLINRL